MSKPIAGAQLYTCRDFCKSVADAEYTINRVMEIGYKAVQISGFGFNDPEGVAKVVEKTGVDVAATHMGWPRFLNDLDAVIAEHQMWNCRHAAIGGLPGEYFCEEGVDRFLEELKPIAEKLADAGLDFSYHNHNHEFTRYGGKVWLDELYSKAAPEMLKAEIDTYWIQAGGASPATWVQRMAGRQPLLHLKDMCIVPNREQRFAPIGSGNLDWPEIFKAADEGGVEYMLVEQDQSYRQSPFDVLAESYAFLKANGYS